MRDLKTLARDDAGSTIVEFALIGPAFLIMMLGVLQIGIALQNYNALRNVSADTARYAMVQHQTGNTINNNQIRTYAINHSTGAPYLLSSTQLNAVVDEPLVRRVADARELNLTMSYQIDSLLGFAGIDGPFITYSRPIFLLDNTLPAT
ncbi:TadE/TadG family type IV pilus assembly protein [Aurantiacibacter spongiae]|nr:TadE family protein [Aurantiacibacter spongiae]